MPDCWGERRVGRQDGTRDDRVPYVDLRILCGLRVLLGILIESVGALLGAEIEGSAIMFSGSFGILFSDLHSAYWIHVCCASHLFLLLFSIEDSYQEMS